MPDLSGAAAMFARATDLLEESRVPHLSFTSPTGGEEVSFDLNGEEYRCVSALPAGLTLDVINAATEGDMRRIGEFFDLVLVEADIPRFNEAIRDKDHPVDLPYLGKMIRELLTVYMGRPTGLPSASGDGQETTEQTSTDAVSSPG